MSTILDRIIADKHPEVHQRQQATPISALQESPLFDRTVYSLRERLSASEGSGIIAEFKRRSPSKGLINGTAEVADVARGYAEAGASGMSVLTDRPYFGGSAADLHAARAAVSLPLLRKEFMVAPYQVYEAKAWGADLILLIAAALSPAQTQELADCAHTLGLEVLLEIHTVEELGHIGPAIDIVGVNNRNLKDFSVSLQTSLDLAPQIPAHCLKISESGLSDPADLPQLQAAGFRGFLMGEAFMKTEDPGGACGQFIAQLQTARSHAA